MESFYAQNIGKFDIYWFYNDGVHEVNIPLNVALSVINAEDNMKEIKKPVTKTYFVSGDKKVDMVWNGDYKLAGLKYGMSESDVKSKSFTFNDVDIERRRNMKYDIEWDKLVAESFLVIVMESKSGIFAGSAEGTSEASGTSGTSEVSYRINTIQVNPDYSGNKLCDVMIDFINKQVDSEVIMDVSIRKDCT